ncbi:MAG: GIY-YIG nuclease family protein [candidate division Zixibacteria bacterium]|nr:GIY-YIG nuclease family protein [candidate division Zixibacteria bacterium]
MYTVYVLRSHRGLRYIGHTSNLDQRLREHNSGTCKTTKVDTGWVVVYQETFGSRSEAMKREKWLKSGAGREFLRAREATSIDLSRQKDQ